MGLFSSIFGGSKKELTPRQFTDEFASRLRKAMPGLKLEILRDLELEMTISGGHESTSFLNNAYDEYRLDPKAENKIIEKFVKSNVETIEYSQSPASLDRTRIIPVVKDRRWLEEMRQALISRGAKKLPENVFDDLNSELVVIYAEDSPKNIRYFGPDDLRKAGIDRAELRNLACDNLKKLIPHPQRRGSNGIFMLTAGGDYEASLLLYDKIWEGMKADVKGDVVVGIPSRDVLLVTGSEDPDKLAAVKTKVQEIHSKGSYNLTTRLFVYRNSRFEIFEG